MLLSDCRRHCRPDLLGLRVLVVDDNATNRFVLETQLREWHMSPTAVSSLAQFRQFQNLLDALAARELRGEPGLVAFADSMDSDDHEPSDESAWFELSRLIRKRGLAIREARGIDSIGKGEPAAPVRGT